MSKIAMGLTPAFRNHARGRWNEAALAGARKAAPMTVDDDMDDEDTHQVRVPTRGRRARDRLEVRRLLATRARARNAGRPRARST